MIYLMFFFIFPLSILNRSSCDRTTPVSIVPAFPRKTYFLVPVISLVAHRNNNIKCSKKQKKRKKKKKKKKKKKERRKKPTTPR